jgi:hypothetical protein
MLTPSGWGFGKQGKHGGSCMVKVIVALILVALSMAGC